MRLILFFSNLIYFRIGTGSGNDAVYAVVVEKLTNIGNQLQFVVDMVEQKTAKKDGSQASVGEFKRFFSFSKFPAATWLTAPVNTAFRHSASDLIRSHQLAMKNKRDTGFVKEVEHVQGESKSLLQQLMDLYFPDQYVEIIPERTYSCRITNRHLESIIYSGKTAAVIKSNVYDIAALCWEIKSRSWPILFRCVPLSAVFLCIYVYISISVYIFLDYI